MSSSPSQPLAARAPPLARATRRVARSRRRPEATLSWYNANVTAAPGYPFNQVGYRSPAGSLAVKQCTGNRVFLDITTWCQWCADYNASYLSVALATAAPTVASTVFGSKEGANGAVLIVSEPLIPTTSTLGVAAVAPKAPTPVAAGRRRLLTGAGNFTNPARAPRPPRP